MCPEISSLADLKDRAATDPQYDALAVVAARNLGASLNCNLADAFLFLNAMALDTELGEEGLVDEINFVRDLVPEELARMRRGKNRN